MSIFTRMEMVDGVEKREEEGGWARERGHLSLK